MDENALRCPQCGSPVLATANYCVICGIRLPDPPALEPEENLGWDAPRPANEPSQPIPPVEVSDWGIVDPDDLAENEVADDDAVVPAFETIPDLALSDLDEFIASEAAAASVPVTDESDEADEGGVDDELIEIESMVDEGSPVNPEAEDGVENPDASQSSASPESEDIATAGDSDGADVAAYGVTSDDSSVLTEPVPVDEPEETSSDSPAHQPVEIAAHAEEPLPLISASYPEFEDPALGEAASEGYGQDWSNIDGDPDWIYTQSYATAASRTRHESHDAPPGDSNAATAIERAEALIDELKSLLPRISQSNSGGSQVNRADLHALALAARGERSFDDWAALRSVVNTAVGRSTDIETILQLSKRVDDIAALLAERDRLQAAFDQLIEATKPVQGT